MYKLLLILLFVMPFNAFSAWPDATNTGVPAGTSLTTYSGTYYTSSAGQVITGLNITNGIVIQHNNVTVRNTRVSGSGYGGYQIVHVNDNITGTVFEDCEISGPNTANNGAVEVNGSASFYRCSIHHINGVVMGSNTTLQDNWIHDIVGSTHTECLRLQGGQSNNLVTHNSLDMTNSTIGTAMVFINGYWGNITDNVFSGNRMTGGSFVGYSVYSTSNTSAGCAGGTSSCTTSGTQYVDNIIEKGSFSWIYPASGTGSTQIAVWSGNTDLATGRLINSNNTLGDFPTTDTTPPSVPTSLIAAEVSPNQINLSWVASTDNTVVASYDIRRCSGSGCTTSTIIASPVSNSYSNTGLTQSTLYRYDVRAKDAAGNVSNYSSIAEATTLDPDSTNPSQPGTPSITATGNNTTSLTWAASTDNVAVSNYILYRCSGAGCTPSVQIATPSSTSYSDSGLTKNTVYRYSLKSVDTSLNQSAMSGIGQVTTENNTYNTPAVDSSTPAAIKSAATTLTTSSFNPPANSVLVVVLLTQNQSTAPTVSSSGLVFTLRGSFGNTSNDTNVYMWTAPISSSGSRTVTVTKAGSANYAMMRAIVFNGVSLTSPVGSVFGNRGYTGAISTSYTSSSDNSWGWALYADWTQGAIPTPGTGLSVYDSYTVAGEDTYAILQKTAITPTGGTAVTMNTTAPTSGRQTSWMHFEMLPSVGSVADTTAPTVSMTAPTNGSNVQGASVAVTATASDNVGVVGVQFKLDGANLGSEDTSAPYAATLDSMVLSDGPHTLTAVARDAAGNSTTSTSVSITVDNNAPSAPTGLGVTAASGNQLNLSWTASTDTVGVSSYDVRRCSGAGCTPSTIIASPTTNSFSNTGLSNLTLYRYDVRAKDAIGNASSYSSIAQATTLDSTAPTAPANVTATAISSSQINLAWDASTDNAAVANYSVERCAGSGCSNYLEISTPATTSLNNTGLQPSTIYRYRVRAKDTSNNFSTYSATAQATTQAVAPTDTTPPVITITGPAAVLAIGTTSAAITATTDEAATCKIATAANIPFASKSAMGTTGTTSHSQTVTISDGKVIHRWIACQDAAGNISADKQVSFSVTTAKRKRGRM